MNFLSFSGYRLFFAESSSVKREMSPTGCFSRPETKSGRLCCGERRMWRLVSARPGRERRSCGGGLNEANQSTRKPCVSVIERWLAEPLADLKQRREERRLSDAEDEDARFLLDDYDSDQGTRAVGKARDDDGLSAETKALMRKYCDWSNCSVQLLTWEETRYDLGRSKRRGA